MKSKIKQSQIISRQIVVLFLILFAFWQIDSARATDFSFRDEFTTALDAGHINGTAAEPGSGNTFPDFLDLNIIN
jgi:hypothetical protein